MHHRSSHPERHHLVIEIPHLRSTVGRALVIALETAVIPTVLLMLLLHYVGLVAGLCAVLGWCAFVLGTRRALGKEMPRTLLLCTGMLAGKAAFALVTSSAVVYVLQPAVGSVLMFLLFVGSAALGKPITERLAKDFVHLPAEVFANKAVRRVFINVALLWGGSRLIDAAMTLGFLHWSVEAGLFSRGVLSGLLTALTIAVCAGHGWRALRKLPGVTLRLGAKPAVA
ncbi:hypothetical protein DI005_19780 [Prauserella sp. PE36]|uniref:Intracellular septation protein A n=1 Tax=Prauserella endophytica TaxID=1592324 RepID=A0ABY2S5W9_9PSEU|nr:MULTISPECIES: hypothetical protein [Prauserella]PXY23593.1 hypothetical protein BAY59_28480 [Prauserella coralliicola]RBM18183.1 hypothetical protein DI005_19780 [Prauserella sp. PE36]TKG70422.1 hypothetical protein FCN18_16095 [Prauserella endophytica]